MKKVLILLSVSIMALAACGQTANDTDQTDTDVNEESNITEAPEQTEVEDEAETEDVADAETDEPTQDHEDSDSTEETIETSEAEEAVVSAGGDTASDETNEDARNETSEDTGTTSTELGEDEIADPPYSEVESEQFQEAISSLQHEFSNQLLSIQLENEDWDHVYAVVTDGLKLPSDEEREFHVTQMAESMINSLDLKTHAPNGTITFVYEDQSELATYHTEDASLHFP